VTQKLETLPLDKNVVALALDDKMVYGFLVLVHSLLTTSTTPPFLLVGFFEGRLSATNVALIERYLSWLGVDHTLQSLTAHELFTERRHLTITTFSKFVISDHYAAAHLWVDLDTVAKPGWDDIFTTMNKAKKDVAMVVADKITGPQTRFDGFNAGVLGWTKNPRKEWLTQLANLPEKRFSSEQFLFNTLYLDSVQYVDVGFNFLSSWHKDYANTESVRIIHYSGPIKPWHLARRHRQAWRSINPTWEEWFLAEDELLGKELPRDLAAEIRAAKKKALFSGRLHTGKGALAGWVMRALAILGPLGDSVVAVIRRRSGA
jgi:lipopolysaccharide biosynthesis glycosyltransferase